MAASGKMSLQIAVIVLILCLAAAAAALVLPFSGFDTGVNGVGPAGQTTSALRGDLILYCIAGLVLLGLCGIGLGEIATGSPPARKAEMPDGRAAAKTDAIGLKLEIEARALIELLRAHLTANNRYSASLSQAHKDLLSAASRDQIQLIVNYLLIENEKMETKTASLERSLETSRSQIEELRVTLGEAREMGLRDPLTALSNRRHFDEVLTREIAESKALGTELSLILADIDRFKAINDKFGHLMGDEVLKLFSKLLLDNVKGRDTVARFGGEEFAIILPHTGLENAERIAEQIRGQLEGNRWVMKQTKQWIGKITASFGIAQFGGDDSAEQLVGRADGKLYEAKSLGRNRVVAAKAEAKLSPARN